MQVDPFTGLPMEGTPDANSAGAQMSVNELAQMGASGPLLDALSNIPGVSTTMAWNMGRVQRTMMHGGRRPGSSARGIRQTLNPLNMGRLDDVRNISPRSGKMPDGKPFYSPFNFLADTANKSANWGARRTMKGDNALASYTNARRRGLINPDMARDIKAGKDVEFVSKGTLGQINTGLRASRMSANDPRFARMSGSARTLNPQASSMIDNLLYDKKMVMDPKITRDPRGRFLHGSKRGIETRVPRVMSAGDKASVGIAGIRGSASGKAAGYITEMAVGGVTGNEFVTAGSKAAQNAMNLVAKEAGTAAGQRVTTGAALKTLGSKTVATEGARAAAVKVVGTRALAGAMRYVPYVGQAMMAYDLTKVGLSLMTGIADTAKDAVHSFKGSIDKPIMGMGYKDNSVAATSRARGVMAIQNSRLNARSVLGSEGAALAAHFG